MTTYNVDNKYRPNHLSNALSPCGATEALLDILESLRGIHVAAAEQVYGNHGGSGEQLASLARVARGHLDDIQEKQRAAKHFPVAEDERVGHASTALDEVYHHAQATYADVFTRAQTALVKDAGLA